MLLQLSPFLLLSALIGLSSSSAQCPAPPPGRLYSTKTSYEALANLSPHRSWGGWCTPQLYWSLVRHGTRYPGEDDIEAMLGLGNGLRDKLLDARGSKLCPKQKEDLRKWQVFKGLSVKDAKKLTKSGRDEQKKMGSRLQNRMTRGDQTFFSDYKEEEFVIRHSKKERAESSSKEFMKGMFPGVNVAVGQDNAITRYYDNCEKWDTEVDHSKATLEQRDTFKGSVEYKELLSNLTDHLGVTITAEDVELMYDTCRFEMAWSPETTSPWCNVFTHHQINLINFAKDLKYYYLNGYGTKLNQEVACPAINDFLIRAEEKVSSSKSSPPYGSSKFSPKAAFYFSHSDAVMMLLSALGLYRDSADLTAHSFALHGNSRQWDTSRISPFSANVAIVLLECENEGSGRNPLDDGYYIEILHNERKVVIEECGEDCTWENFSRIFAKFKKCEQEKTCALSGGMHATKRNVYFWLPIALILSISNYM